MVGLGQSGGFDFAQPPWIVGLGQGFERDR